MSNKKKKFYISFGQAHAHRMFGKTLDKDCILVLQEKDVRDAQIRAMKLFGREFSMVYERLPEMKYFPRGLIKIK